MRCILCKSSLPQVIDQNDPEGKPHALNADNPIAKKIIETTENQVAAELVRDYLEHFKLDYTLSIFLPESGLKEAPLDRNEVARKAGVQVSDEPLLVSLLK